MKVEVRFVMPRTPEENERIRQLAKENIRASAMEVFMERGYYNASIDDIAKRAGVSKGLLYNYYKGKEDLLAEMVQGRIDEIKEVMETASRLDSPSEQLKRIIDGAIDNTWQNPKVFRFYLNLQTQPEEDQVLSKYSSMLNQEMAQQFEVQCDMFHRLGVDDPIIKSLYFSSTLQGISLMMSTYPEHFPVHKVKEQLFQQFCEHPSRGWNGRGT